MKKNKAIFFIFVSTSSFYFTSQCRSKFEQLFFSSQACRLDFGNYNNFMVENVSKISTNEFFN